MAPPCERTTDGGRDFTSRIAVGESSDFRPPGTRRVGLFSGFVQELPKTIDATLTGSG